MMPLRPSLSMQLTRFSLYALGFAMFVAGVVFGL